VREGHRGRLGLDSYRIGGVGVIVGKCGRYFASMPARIAVNGIPDV
jgi:hypothetical protein